MNYLPLLPNQVPALLEKSDVAILDVRDQLSFERGHLPGAQPADDANITRLIKSRRFDRPVLVYCYHGNSSRDLCRLLVGFGFAQIYNLEGGWQAWTACQERHDVRLSNTTTLWLESFGFDTSNLNSRIDNGMSALMVAAKDKQLDVVKELVEAGIDVNLLNDDGNPALWFACVSGDTGIIRHLVRNHADINSQNVNGATCLIYAASAGKLDVVKALIEAGADMARQTLDGFTALDSASTLPILRLLKPYYVCTAQSFA